jgi:hypothetical protein
MGRFLPVTLTVASFVVGRAGITFVAAVANIGIKMISQARVMSCLILFLYNISACDEEED